MGEEASKLLEKALRLPPEARGAIAASLIESLDSAVDENAEATWAAAIEQRLTEVDSGTVRPIPWSEVRRRILASE